jgi:O-acetyl-ADP-ribose deacetylase (regulator of RNase III)
MPLKFVTGNLFESDCDALVNTVNTVGVMGAGIALQFKNLFPENYILYKNACKDGIVVTGKMFTTVANFKGRKILIVNFPTKEHWRNPSKLNYIEEGLISLANGLRMSGINSIAIPALGCSNGALNWLNVKELIVSHLGTIDKEILIYEPLL